MQGLYTAKQVALDVECFPNFFCVSISDLKDNLVTFIFDKKQDDRPELIKFLDHCDKGIEVITFNGKHYDCPILNFVRLNPTCTTEEIKEFSDIVINVEAWWKEYHNKKYKYHHKWVDIDLFLYWSQMLRRAKKISLKGLAIQLRYPVVQELPIKHDALVTDDNRDMLLEYNSVHDIGIMKYLMEKTFNWQGKKSSFPEMIALRKTAMEQYKFDKNCMSWDAVKLGLNVALSLNTTEIGEPRHFTKFGEVVSDKIKFYTPQLTKLLSEVKEWPSDKKLHLHLNYLGAALHMKQGGIHTSNNPCTVKEKEGYIFHSLDVSGYYPALGETLKVKLHEQLGIIRRQRLELKHKGLGKTPEANLLKLSANSLVGNFQQEKGEIYDPVSFFTISINGQLFLLMLMEWVSHLGVELVMANTDGFEVFVPENNYDKFMSMCKTWEEYTGFELEHFRYKAIYMQHVNSYLGVFDDGTYKEKGWFVTDPDLGNKVDFLAVPKAVNNYLLHNIPIEETLSKCSIYDFCGAQKLDKTYTAYLGGDKLPQRLNVYYVSTKGNYLMKGRGGKKAWIADLTKIKVEVFNKYHEGPYDIDMTFYKNKADKMLQELGIKSVQTTLF